MTNNTNQPTREHAELLPDGGMKISHGPVPTYDIGTLGGRSVSAIVETSADRIGIHMNGLAEYLTVTGETDRNVALLLLPTPKYGLDRDGATTVLDLVLASVADDLSGSFQIDVEPVNRATGTVWQITGATYINPEGERFHAWA